jgi:hypothetical protein
MNLARLFLGEWTGKKLSLYFGRNTAKIGQCE